VFVAKADDTVEMRPVTTGLITDTLTEITSGLKAGERVVTDGQLRLKDKAQVVVQAPGAGNTASGASAVSAASAGQAEAAKVGVGQ
jgi:multidrug efflux system membrane fusion protein